jgi:hypothetical protein
MSGNKYESDSLDATLARIETKMDAAIASLTEQNRRLVVLEVAENKRVGALVAIGTVCSLFGGAIVMVVDFFKNK